MCKNISWLCLYSFDTGDTLWMRAREYTDLFNFRSASLSCPVSAIAVAWMQLSSIESSVWVCVIYGYATATPTSKCISSQNKCAQRTNSLTLYKSLWCPAENREKEERKKIKIYIIHRSLCRNWNWVWGDTRRGKATARIISLHCGVSAFLFRRWINAAIQNKDKIE